jgi:hypothetical protein
MDAERVEMQIAALLDQADVEHARVREAISELRAAGIALREGVVQAAGSAVKDSFTGLQGDIERARRAMKWFSYRWIVIVAVSLVGLFALGAGLAWALLALQRHQLTELIERKTALEADIAEMQVNAAALAKRGARIKIEDCGGKLCIVANKHQGEREPDWSGFWYNKQTKEPWVIPKGY